MEEKKVVKLGIIGLVRGRDMVGELIKDDNVKLTAICDRDPERLAAAIEHFRVRGIENLETYDNFEDFLKSDTDAIIIATEATCHVPYAIKAMDAGKHVLSEIPTVNSVEEAKQLRAAVKSHPELKYMAGENACYFAFIQAWKSMYENGKLGQAVYAESEYLHAKDYRQMKADDYAKDSWRKFNPPIKYLTHNLGPLLYIMDDKCVSVTCMEPDVKYNPYRKDKNQIALFKTAKGAVIRILICFDAYVGFDHNFEIIGTRGMIETDKTELLNDANSFAKFSDLPVEIDDRKIEIPIKCDLPSERMDGHGGADYRMLKDFIKCIIDDTEPPLDVDFGIRISLPGIIASESVAQNSIPLEIPDLEIE